MSNKKFRIPYTPSCWNCRKLRKSIRVIHENTLDKPHGGCFSMSAPSMMDALAGYMCDKYWFGDKPDKDIMLCGGREYEPVHLDKYDKDGWRLRINCDKIPCECKYVHQLQHALKLCEIEKTIEL